MANLVALTPPMGWNSWDCYGASVREDEVRGSAEYMAANLKQYGWEYVVVDIQWFEPNAKSDIYNPHAPLVMDEYSRLMPAVNRFPSAANGKGFKPLADYVHSLGLKFGIHILRGIPRQAVAANTAILGTAYRAADIANTNSTCAWNTDMYGVDPAKPGAQEYYNSLFQLYAEWEVDYVKVDDIAAPTYHGGEIELIRKAITNCSREMVLSLSPGPTSVAMGDHVAKYANMWRMTNDFWDRWEDLQAMFGYAHAWSRYIGPGHWPDADMLPLGRIGIRSAWGDRYTRFTRDEQVTLMSLWAMIRSPLMFGGDLRYNDEWTTSLITNEEVLNITKCSHANQQLYRGDNAIAWTAVGEDGRIYLAHFNVGEVETTITTEISKLGLSGRYQVRDLWVRQDLGVVDHSVSTLVPVHGSRLLQLTGARGMQQNVVIVQGGSIER
ncbi:MAG: glycoside hydrolase family 27 protein [Firmicutes bacterium]|nr:glycoside hydrolase family 27 protein [Bacillota bacterium]NLL88166.1 glycoside hydrolase family 27 protein [Bacillota bacterium]